MTSKQQKELRKKKKLEQHSHAKVLYKRDQLRNRAKVEKEDWRQDRRIAKLQRDLDRLNTGIGVPVEGLPEKTVAQLEHNVEILKALEGEHEKDRQGRQKLNQELEDQGHKTLQDKLNALHAAMAQDMGVGGSAECRMSIAPKEVSDVEVVKVASEENFSR